MGVIYHGHFSFRNGRELPWPFFFSIFFHNWLELSSHFPFCSGLDAAGVISTGLPTPTFHKSAQFEVISFTHFISCRLPFIYCLLEFSGFK
jgi:hypothetical protein